MRRTVPRAVPGRIEHLPPPRDPRPAAAPPPRRSPTPLRARLGLFAAFVAVAVLAGVLLSPREALARLPWSSGPACTEEKVDVLVEPELAPVVDEALAPLVGTELPDNHCIGVQVRSQQAVEAVASSSILPADRAPQVWIPDSSTWADQAPSWRTEQADPIASSPVVVATSTAAAEQLGWTRAAPTWDQALRGARPMAVPNIQSEADGLSALIALWQTLGKGPAADSAVVNVVLAADRGEVPTTETAFAAVRAGSVNAPVVPSTEQAVAATNRPLPQPRMTAVYPREGSPMLTYPVLRVNAGPQSALRREATTRVLHRLASPGAQQLARAAGFRSPAGEPGAGDGVTREAVRTLAPPAAAEVAQMTERITKLGRPTRILCIIDVSLSMRALLDDGLTRIQVAAAAARTGANLLPDSSSVGAWVFASDYPDGNDWREVAPIAPLGSTTERGETHRRWLGSLVENPTRYLKNGGTSLYDSTLAAFRHMQQTYDPGAENGIILISDGANEDDGTTLDQLLAEIRRSNTAERKVPIFTAGLGPDADFDALKQIGEASGGYSYRVDNALQGQNALLDGLRRNLEGRM